MNANELIKVAAEAGKIILENGGETYRVEETIFRICSAYGEKSAESFVTPTGIVISISTNNKNLSVVKRIKNRTVNLEKIQRVNDLSRKVCCNWMPLDEFKYELKKINNTPRYSGKTSIFFASLAASFFTLLFGGNMRDSIAAFLVGALIYKTSNILGKYNVNSFFVNILGGFMAALIAYIMVLFGIGSNIDKITIGSIMLLVPGLSITNAVRDTIAGDLVSGISRAIEAFLVAIGIAIGSGIVVKIIFNFGGI
ncbi:threonine/serine ThrE exporter family protein [Haloimpatiens lingqiaonensis]|uniref:threonine/serine ThrE exporter family protein n=1 Tax=Haloimpatiens lingqiaonensis TaxID=1380675 RepID=UPI0010FE03F2|nr:threonine/serine exporter family protein [Haloimpatiens lingqiaonensis]